MDAQLFRGLVRELVRALGVLDEARTPCGVDVSVREAYALEAIARAEAAGAPISQSELQAQLRVDKSNVTRVVQQLAGAGRVEQRTSEHDARVRHLHLTTKGRRLSATIDERSLRRFAAVLGRIEPAERPAVVRAMQLLCEALDAESCEARS